MFEDKVIYYTTMIEYIFLVIISILIANIVLLMGGYLLSHFCFQ